MRRTQDSVPSVAVTLLVSLGTMMSLASGQPATYSPYIRPGDNGPFGPTDSIVVAWQTNESTPNIKAYTVQHGTTPSYGQTATVAARVVNNYLAADSSLPTVPTPPDPVPTTPPCSPA